MPNTDSPKVTMENQELPQSLFESKTGKSRIRGWLCPGDHIVAAYVDGTLGSEKTKFESHLVKCPHCRSAVADVVKTQRDAGAVVPPFEIVQKAMRTVPVNVPRRGWV